MPTFTTILVVEHVSEEIRKVLAERDPRVFRFKKLPLIALTADHPAAAPAPLPGVVRRLHVDPSEYGLAWSTNRLLLEVSHLVRTWAPNGNRWACGAGVPTLFPAPRWQGDELTVDWLPLQVPSRIAHPSSLNLSLQLRPGAELVPTDLLSIATRVAGRYMPVVVAAGNWYRRPDRDTLSPLAKLPWTIAVGATADPEGRRLHPLSSAGPAPPADHGGGPVAGPTVVGFGENPFVPGTFGTSFAAPRVSYQIALLTAFILQLQHAVATLDGVFHGPPLLLQCQIDEGFDAFEPTPKHPLPLLPILGVDRNALATARQRIEAAHGQLDIVPRPGLIRQLLVESAVPMPGYGAHEVGAGFVTDSTTLEYIARFTGLDLARMFGRDLDRLTGAQRAALQGIVLAIPREIDALATLMEGALLRYAIDYRTGAVMASMRDPGMDPEERGFRKEASRAGPWPPEL